LKSNAVLTEDLPVAQSLDDLCRIGLDALALLDKGKHADAAWTQPRLATVDAASKPQAEMLIQIAPGVRKLVAAAGGR